MNRKLINKGTDTRTYVLVADPGEHALEVIAALAKSERLSSAQITAIGAFSRATVGWFDRSIRTYRQIPIDRQCEVLSLVGDIALDEDEPSVHVHAVLGLDTGEVRGGHLLDGEVWPTLEVIVEEAPAMLVKRYRPEIGLPLIDLDATRT